MMKYKYCTFLILLISFSVRSQKLVTVTDEVLIVNSAAAYSGYTRNKAEVFLPEKTVGYIYRISILPKGSNSFGSSLLELLEASPEPNISIASSFAKFAIKSNDNNAVDAFIFNNVYDAENFYSKNDNNWRYCKSMMNRGNCCLATKECLGNKIYFGFRNNNTIQGLSVRLEVIAIVDSSSQSNFTYAYSITNSGGTELTYSLSYDEKNWQDTALRNGYTSNFSLDKPYLFFMIKSEIIKL